MYKRLEQLKTDIKLNNEGKEKMFLTHLAGFEESNPKIKLFSFVRLKPGEGVDYHIHYGESETYFILSGKGVYNDNGNKTDITSGMVTLTPSGKGHSIKNTGEEMLVFIALIVTE